MIVPSCVRLPSSKILPNSAEQNPIKQRIAGLLQHDVGRLDVAMHNLAAMGIVQRGGQVHYDFYGTLEDQAA